VSDLERDLRALGATLVLPPTPDIASAVARDLVLRPHPVWRRLAPVAIAVLALAIGVTMAVPPARTAVLRFFGVGAVHVRFVDKLPAVAQRTIVPAGRELSREDWPEDLPRSPLLGQPDSVYADGGTITEVFGSPGAIRLLLTSIPSSPYAPDVVKKLAGVEGTQAVFVVVRGATGAALWIEGRKHTVRFPGWPPRLGGNTLVWVRGTVTLRIEGELGRDEAVRIANSLR
jgi:hypothetical protein